MYSHSDLIAGGIWFILMIVLCGLMLIVGQVLLGVAVYHNAKAYCNQSSGMWCALTILFGWIPAVIYLATRHSGRNRLMSCPNCHAVHPVGLANCPQCGGYNPYSEPFHSPNAQQEIACSKKFLIAAIVLMGVGILAIVACVFVFLFALVPYIDTHIDSSYFYRHYW